MKTVSNLQISASLRLPVRKPRSFASLSLQRRSFYGRKPRRYTGKEQDSETGLYYYGARYLDSRTGRWLSGDPAVSDYIPSAPVNEEARKRNGSLPGMGGVFNYANLHVYHYAGNNPVKYTDPDGESVTVTLAIIGGLSSATASIITDLVNNKDVNFKNAGAAAIGGAIAGAMIGSVIDTCGASGAAIGTLVATGGLSNVVGGGVTEILKGENPLELGKVAANAAYGVAGAMLGQSIGKLGELATGKLNQPYKTYMQNTNTKSAAPLTVTFKDTLKKISTNQKIMNTVNEATKQAVDISKDVHKNINGED